MLLMLVQSTSPPVHVYRTEADVLELCFGSPQKMVPSPAPQPPPDDVVQLYFLVKTII